MSIAAPTTRKPTGRSPWPSILIEGDEKAGKSWICAEFTGSERVGQAYWIDLAEGAGDEYASLGDYLYVIHDGTFGSIHEQIVRVRAVAKAAADAGEKPVVLVVDGINALWDSLKDWVTARARRTKKAKALLAKDPNAEIKPATFLWNDANDRWNRIINQLVTFPGIVLITAKGKEVAVMGDDGNPIPGQKDWRVATQKDLGFQVNAWLRLRRAGPASIVGVRSVHRDIGFRPGSTDPVVLPDDWTLDWFIFDGMRLDPARTQVRDYKPIDAATDLPPGVEYISPQDFLSKVADAWENVDALGELYREAVARGIADHDVTLPDRSTWELGEFIQRRGSELMERGAVPGQQQAPPAQPEQPAAPPTTAPPVAQAAPPAQEPPSAPPVDDALAARLRDLQEAVLEATATEQLQKLWRDNSDVLDVVVSANGETFANALVRRQTALAAQAVGA